MGGMGLLTTVQLWKERMWSSVLGDPVKKVPGQDCMGYWTGLGWWFLGWFLGWFNWLKCGQV